MAVLDLCNDLSASTPEPARRVVQHGEAARGEGVMALLHVFEKILAGVSTSPIRLVDDSR
jgi:hypothetical protein